MSAIDDRRKHVMVGELPNDFLRLSNQQQQIEADHHTAQMLQSGWGGYFPSATANMARLSITVVQAKLTKNYGLVKMDPYCRVRLGHSIFETPTSHGGSKNPRWNKTFQCYLPNGIDNFYVEIYDERAFTMDELVAWVHVTIPSRVFDGQTSDEWYGLSGKQGEEGKEGAVNIVMTYTPQQAVAPRPVPYGAMPGTSAVMVMPAGTQVFYPQGPPTAAAGYPVPMAHGPRVPQGPLFTPEDVQQVQDMFPNVDNDVIKSVLEANRGNKDSTINHLLGMES